MSRKRLGKRERKARNSKKRRGAHYVTMSNGVTTEHVRLKVGRKKSDKLWKAHLKSISKSHK